MPRRAESSIMSSYSLAIYTPSQMFIKHRPVAAGTLVLAFLLSSALSAAPVKTDHSQVELVAETSSIAPGTPFTLGLRLAPDAGWHTYWINPGDAGKAAQIKWDLPVGFEVSELEFPAPGFVPFGPLLSYGYNETTLLTVEVSVPEEIDEEVRLAGRASWLVCDDQVCIPERASVTLVLPRGNGEINPGNRPEFAAARAAQPLRVPWKAEYRVDGDKIQFSIDLPAPLSDATDIYLFPAAEKMIDHVATQDIALDDERLVIGTVTGPRVDRYDSTDVVLSYMAGGTHKQALWLRATRTQGELVAMAALNPGSSAGSETGAGGSPAINLSAFAQAIFFAFLGGLILNLMPCVLPILSLKALSLAEISDSAPRTARLSGLYYTLGVVVCFLILALIMIGLRSAGERIGWAFHLQDPQIVGALALIMFVVGMNFLGTFELRGNIANFGGWTEKLTRGRGTEFFTGALAVIVASPCTVPFMSPALGFALVQPSLVALTVFVSLGLGFALPYLLMALIPGARALLPKPGKWMETFRHLLAFPMFATAAWLLWVLGRQAGVDALGLVLAAMIGLGFALWSWGRMQTQQGKVRWSLSATAGALLAAAGLYLASSIASTPVTRSPDAAQQQGVFSERLLADLHSQDVPVFAYFTADWCITCKVNEKVALQSDRVQDYFEASGTEVLVGDWTNEDPAITGVLERHGRSGVPLYLFFRQGGNIETPLILPSLLTPELVVNTLEQA